MTISYKTTGDEKSLDDIVNKLIDKITCLSAALHRHGDGAGQFGADPDIFSDSL